MSFSNLSVRVKLISICMLIGLAPACIVCTLAWNATLQLSDTRLNGLKQTARSLADKVDRNLFERYGDVQAFGLNGVIANHDNWYVPGEEKNEMGWGGRRGS